MKTMRLLATMMLVLVPLLITGCVSTVPKPLRAGEARISGQKPTMWKKDSVYITLDSPDSKAERTQAVPAGKVRVKLSYDMNTAAQLGVLAAAFVDGSMEQASTRIVEFTAKAGHEYYAEVQRNSILTAVWNIEYKITDQTTGQVVLVTTKNNKPSRP